MTAIDPGRGGRDRQADELDRQYYRSLLEVSPVAVVTTDLKTLITSWNPEAERLFGYTPAEALGRRLDDLIANSDDLRAEAAAFESETARTGSFRAVTRRIRKDGSHVDVDMRAATVAANGEAVGYYVLYHDISELQQQKQYYASLLDLSPTAVVALDLDARVTSWNEAAERLFGYPEAEVIGRHIDDVVAPEGDVRADATELTRRGLDAGEIHLVTRRPRRDGTFVDVEVRSAPIVVGAERVGFFIIYHDISELQRQKQFYESLFELNLTAIAVVGADSNVSAWNPAAERLFGYTAEEAVGRQIDDLVAADPRVREEAEHVSAQNAGDGEEIQLVTQRTRKDGSLVDVQVLAAPITVGGEHVGQYALYHDISALQRQQRYYESLLGSSPSAIVTLELDTTVTSWNAAAEGLFGYTRDEALGRNLDDLIARRDDMRAEADAINRAAVAGELNHHVTRRMRKDGSLVDVDIVGTQIVVSGEPVGLFGIYSDIGDLQRQRRYYEALFELSPTAIATVDLDDNVTSWNAAAERLFGYSAGEAIGRNIDELVASDKGLRMEGAQLARQAQQGGRVRRVTRRQRKDGSFVDVDLRAAPIIVAGETIGIFCLYHDITELERARPEAEAANRAKTRFWPT